MLKASLSKILAEPEEITITAVNLDNQQIEYLKNPKDRSLTASSSLKETVFLKDGNMVLQDFIHSSPSTVETPSDNMMERLNQIIDKGLKYLNIPFNKVGISSETDALIHFPDEGLSITWEALPIKMIENDQTTYRYGWAINKETYFPGSFHEPPSSDVDAIAFFPEGKECALACVLLEQLTQHKLQNALQALSEDNMLDEQEESLLAM